MTATSAAGGAWDRARTIADAVLYEGYVLYPYRASAAKNQVRWQFGVLAPPGYCALDPSEASLCQTESVVDPGDHPRLDVKVRCLQVQSRSVEVASADPRGFEPVGTLEVDGTLWSSWDEAVAREVDLCGVVLDPLEPGWRAEHEHCFELPASRAVESLIDESGTERGRVVRTTERVAGALTVSTAWLDGPTPLVKVTAWVENRSPWSEGLLSRDDVVRRSLVAAHTLLVVHDGAFLSQLDPPEFAAGVVAGCEQIGTFPVLAGPEGDHEVVLSSPIILYDHPEVAPESQGDLFDATEIDEILALRVLTLTEEEKREARATDVRAAEIVERIDTMPPEIFERLHGAVRSLRSVDTVPDHGSTLPGGMEAESEAPPWWDPGSDQTFDPATDTVWVAGTEVGRGCRVRLRPMGRADAHDMFLAGKLATVEAVLHDVDGAVHVAVVLDDDPGADLFAWQGRFNYFRPDELEVVDS